MVKSCISNIYAYVLFYRAVSILICMGHYFQWLGLFILKKKWPFVACSFCLTLSHLTSAIINDICTYSFLLSLPLSSLPPFASVFSPTPSLPPVFLLLYCIPSWGACICRGASWSQGMFLPALTFAPTVPRFSLLCFVLSGFIELACDTAGCNPSLDTVPDSLRSWVYQWQDASAEALGMWVFAIIYIHGWMQPTWSRMFCLVSSHREVWLKSPASVCMCDCVSFSADGQTSSE